MSSRSVKEFRKIGTNLTQRMILISLPQLLHYSFADCRLATGSASSHSNQERSLYLSRAICCFGRTVLLGSITHCYLVIKILRGRPLNGFTLRKVGNTRVYKIIQFCAFFLCNAGFVFFYDVFFTSCGRSKILLMTSILWSFPLQRKTKTISFENLRWTRWQL